MYFYCIVYGEYYSLFKVETTVASVFEIRNSIVKKLCNASGGAFGGKQVEQAFNQLLIKIVGAPVLMTFYQKHRPDYEDLVRQLHTQMRKIPTKVDGMDYIFSFPFSLQNAFEKETGETITESIKNADLKGKLTVNIDKIRMNRKLFENLFKDLGTQMIALVNDLLQKLETKGTDTIYMVGGFSEFPILQNMIKKAFPRMRVIISSSPNLEVLRGAVLYGHENLIPSY